MLIGLTQEVQGELVFRPGFGVTPIALSNWARRFKWPEEVALKGGGLLLFSNFFKLAPPWETGPVSRASGPGSEAPRQARDFRFAGVLMQG